MQTVETRIRQMTAALAVMLLTVLSTGPAAALEGAPQVRSGYAPVNGLKIYYEIHGTASSENPPLLLLHGGGSTIETSFGKVLPALAKIRQVVAFEQQGHGHTADLPDRPIVKRSDWLLPMIKAFLDAPMPQARMKGEEKP